MSMPARVVRETPESEVLLVTFPENVAIPENPSKRSHGLGLVAEPVVVVAMVAEPRLWRSPSKSNHGAPQAPQVLCARLRMDRPQGSAVLFVPHRRLPAIEPRRDCAPDAARPHAPVALCRARTSPEGHLMSGCRNEPRRGTGVSRGRKRRTA